MLPLINIVKVKFRMSINIDINIRIKTLRIALGLKQKELCEAVSVSQSFLSQVEKGHFQPSIQLLSGIALAYPQINTHWLLTGLGEMLLSASSTAVPAASQLDGEFRELQAIASQARQDVIWQVFQMLDIHPAGLTLQELESIEGTKKSGLPALLLLLKRQGLVALEGSHYRLSSRLSPLNAHELADVGAAIEQAMYTLLGDVLPRLEHDKTAGILNAELRVKDAETWLATFYKGLLALLTENETETGQRVRIVVSASKS